MAENGAIFGMRNTNVTIRVIESQFSLIDGHYVKVSNMKVSHSTFLLWYYRFNYLVVHCPFSLVSIRVPICHIIFLVLLLAQLQLPQPNDTKQTFLFAVTQTNACLCTCLCVTYLYCIKLWTYFLCCNMCQRPQPNDQYLGRIFNCFTQTRQMFFLLEIIVKSMHDNNNSMNYCCSSAEILRKWLIIIERLQLWATCS
jgi:hypothetical protein